MATTTHLHHSQSLINHLIQIILHQSIAKDQQLLGLFQVHYLGPLPNFILVVDSLEQRSYRALAHQLI